MIALFKDLQVGQRFRLRTSSAEHEKIEPVRRENGGVMYNDGQLRKMGHSHKVMLPPYDLEEQKTKSQKDYQRYTALVKAAGWKSLAEFQKAVLSGAVTIPAK